MVSSVRSGEKPVTLAAITGAHGVTGEVRLKLLGEGISSLKSHKSFNEGTLTLKKLRDDNKGGAIARFDEITDRNEAEKLRGTTLTVPRSALPPLEEGEYYHADLIGLAVVTGDGDTVGTVREVVNYGATDLIEIERPSMEGKRGKRFLVPMTEQAVPEWDEERLVISADFAED